MFPSSSPCSFVATGAGTNATVATNTTVMAARHSGARSTGALPAAVLNDSLQYTCYLCRKSSSLMMRRCPLAKDDCHVACLSLPSPPPSSPPGAAAAAAADGGRDADDCYVMKLYPDGSWVTVDVVSCQAAAACYLVCSSGDARGGDGDGTTRGTLRGPQPHGLADFERCGARNQLIAAPGAAGIGGGIPGV